MYESAPDNLRFDHNLVVEGHVFENINTFTYLGSEINNENKMITEVHKRIMTTNRVYFANLKFFKSSLVSRKMKVRLFITLITTIII